MHTQPMADHEGDFHEAKKAEDVKCRKCGEKSVTVQQWDSHCGGYEDFKYTCQNCQHGWWVEGPDS